MKSKLDYRFSHKEEDIGKPLHDQMLMWVDKNIRDILKSVFPESDTSAEIVTTKWQVVVRQDSNYPGNTRGPIVGILDMFVRDERSGCNGYSIKRDLCAVVVKTEIPSLGELLREIRLCQTGFIDDHEGSIDRIPFIVVCPDDAHVEKLKEQRVYFFKFDPVP